ncbi:Origin recognition complex subunit 2 [Mortierella antarctica]|nr:Origin recognition complex subunit 2 [Mortierella antarctica]
MIHLLYQRNDEIPTHISCEVSKQDAEREYAIAKKLSKLGGAKTQRKWRLGLHSGLTVEKASSIPLAKSKDAREDKENTLALQDVFLPNANTSALPENAGDSADALDSNDSTAMVGHARGREVFGFQTQRKHTGLKNLLEQHEDQQSQHPSEKSPSTRKASGKATKDNLADRFAKRRRLKETISKMNQTSSGEEDDEDEDESESDQDSDADVGHGTRGNEDLGITTHDATEPQESFFEQDEMGAERYFQDLYQKSRTSNNTLSRLPTLEHADFIKAIKGVPVKHAQEKEMLMLLYEEQFPQWYFELISGFSLLIYGYGSKRLLLNKFATTVLTDAPLIIVNGYFPTLAVKEILDRICSSALKYTGPTGTLQEQIALILAYFAQPDRDVLKLYLLVHNIDGSGLRSEKNQAALSLLASCPSIHLIASIDHINANILWDTVKAARFRWVWHELTTFKPYLTETSFENSIMVRQGELGARGIQFVLASLTSNGKGLFKVLAEHQIQSERDGAEGGGGSKAHHDCGMAYNALFRKCQENFLVSNAVTFRTQLTEFRDHRIVQSKKGADGVEILYIPLSANVLESILEKMT